VTDSCLPPIVEPTTPTPQPVTQVVVRPNVQQTVVQQTVQRTIVAPTITTTPTQVTATLTTQPVRDVVQNVGPPGREGKPGPPGEGVDLHYRHIQSTPASSWTIAHNLGKRPSVSVVDSAGTNIVGGFEYVDDNNCTLTFSSSFSGEAYLN